MGDFVEIATKVMSGAAHRVELSAQNISNMTTAGYKRELSFDAISAAGDDKNTSSSALDLTQGKFVRTGNPLDLAIQGDGFFVVSGSGGLFYSRAGQFQLDGNGRLVDAGGFAVQEQGGGDLAIHDGGQPVVQADGTVLENGQPVAKLAVARLIDASSASYAEGGVVRAPASAAANMDSPTILQGAYESSNVSDGDEMVAILQSLRRAEAGSKLVNVYDNIMGRIVDAFGGSNS